MGYQRASQTKNNQTTPKGKTVQAKPTPLGTHSPVHPLLKLQSIIGNQAVNRLIQTKMQVGEPNDVYEKEADSVAAQVMRMSAPPVQNQTEEEDIQTKQIALQLQSDEEEIQTKPIALQLQSDEEEIQTKPIALQLQSDEEEIQTKANPGQTPQVSPHLETKIQSRQGTGQPLPDSTRAFMEPRFGADFSSVRVHTDSSAVQMNKELGAQAFTHGRDIFYGAGKSPGKNSLTAHELTHTIQQTAGVNLQPLLQRQDESSEDTDETSPQFPPGFDPDQKAQELHEAFDGWGTDERKVLDALWTGSRHLTQAIERAYNARYRPNLEVALHDELSGDDLRRALQILGHGELTLRDKIRESVDGWGTDEEKIFNALERASEEELNELRNDRRLLAHLRDDLSGEDLSLVNAYLSDQRTLAGRLRRAVASWGTDEAEIWHAIEGATQEERNFILSQPKLMKDLREDLSEADWIRCERSLRGTLTNVDRIQMAAAGWGTDETALKAALSGLKEQEFPHLPSNVDQLLESELSGDDLVEAQEILHQKRLSFDPEYQEAYLRKQSTSLGEDVLEDEGQSALFAGEGQSQSAVGRLKAASAGLGTDDEAIWQTLNSLTEAERQFIRERNPEGVLNILRDDLSESDYERVMQILVGGAGSAATAIRQAVEGWGTDESLLYNAIDRILREGVASEILADAQLRSQIQDDMSDTQYQVFLEALQTGQFTARMRLDWATAMAGTDEDLVFQLCRQYGSQWYSNGEINSEVDAILQDELSTRDYWQALDLIRGEPQTEEERLARAKEMLERERSGISASIMDSLSSSGEQADDAWREYQATYNQALEDGELTEEEQGLLRRDEAYSQRMTAEYRETAATVSQWATTIAVAIVGIAATILTAGAAGPFVAGLAATLGGNIAVAAEAMVLAAALKVGLNRAIQGEGYDVTSSQALVDAVSAGVEIGLTMVGGQLASQVMQGVGKTALAQSVGPSVQRVFGQAGNRILQAGLEGSIDATVGGIGEGIIQGMAREETWSGEIEDFFSNMGESVATNAAMSGLAGGFAGAGFKSIGEVFGPRLRGKALDEPTINAEEPTARVDEPSALTTESTIRTEEPSTRAEKSTTNLEQPTANTATIKPEENLGELEGVIDLPGRHKLKYTKNGRSYLCSPYCQDVTEFADKFSGEIDQNNWIKTKLDEIAEISDPAQFRKALYRLEDHAELFRDLSAELKDLSRRLSDDAKEGFMQQIRLRSQKEFQGMENAYKNQDGTYDLERANIFFEGRRISGGRDETELAKKDFPPSWKSFEPSLHDKFKERLLEFRGDKNIELPDGFRGGEGQLFLSENHPELALKRWFQKRLGDMGESIRLLKGIQEAVEAHPKLKEDFEVVKIYEQGRDWIIRDFDIDTIPLPRAMDDTDISSKLQAAIEALEGTENEFLQNLRGKLLRQPPSDNIHWSPNKQKFVIIDMQ
ncbi:MULTISPECIES: DUF4157 domain-containing protein [unclassified Moorena]|uniref:eCIS core domain-containing protein n=1 Tax=unclassified Moorena TaxID=2683338 RepID=UPI0013FFB9F6|nr:MULTISPECIES: DUF4157 domain-containing protein [unclassified Moorena]NEO15010.1 DUF4157 domain-containing protein [Moorena sp. SIO3E8]NEQ01414.1 DUF4157 domain-containing protein [Moorena sp. SIO3F7]